MQLIQPRAPERDNQNALRKFPLSDRASGTNGTCTLPSGALIDAQLYVHGRTPGSVWLAEIGEDGRLRFADADGIFAETVADAVPETAVPLSFIGSGGPVPGGVVVFGKSAAVSALLASGGQTFTADQTELAPAAVTYLGVPGVTGFLLDDGNVVSGAVKFKGANGAAVATFVDENGRKCLRLNAVGATTATVTASGFITSVVAVSDNRHFTVKGDLCATDAIARPNRVINLALTGALTCTDTVSHVSQTSLCETVREKTGSVPASRAATGASCGLCQTGTSTVSHTITLSGGTLNPLQLAAFTWFVGTTLGTVYPPSSPDTSKRFTGYYSVPQSDPQTQGVLYYDADGIGRGTFTATGDVTLHAHFMPKASTATATFDGYGTLHLAAPDATGYKNPLQISGEAAPVPAVNETSDDALASGGTEGLAELVLHPTVPQGEVRIGLRGLLKALTT